MFKFLIFALTQVSSCNQDCKLFCAKFSSTTSCLSSCTCQLSSSQPDSKISQYSTWNCSYVIIDACNYSTDFNSCMESANCAYLPSSELLSSQIPAPSLSYIQSLSTRPDSEYLKYKENLVVCDDCKIFEGDDYWECIAEYCKGMKIEGLCKQIQGNLNEDIKLTATSVFGKSLCCALNQDDELLSNLCVSDCEITNESEFDNMKKLKISQKLNKSDEFGLESNKNSELFIIITAFTIIASAGFMLSRAIKNIKTEKSQDYYILS